MQGLIGFYHFFSEDQRRTRTYLAGHHFTVDSADLDAGEEASLIVGVHYIAAPGLVCSDTAVVRSLLRVVHKRQQ